MEPFHILIKSKDTTHSFLYDFYKSLDDSFIKPIKEDFFDFVQPHFPFEKSLFDNVMKHSYDPEVVEAVQLASRNLVEDAIRLANYMLPTLRKMFALQRQDYEFSTHTPQFPVRSQATQIDDVPVHNLSMEQYCGKISQRLDTLKTVEATSRSHILQKTQSLVQNHDRSFRSYAEELKKVQVLKLEWSKRQSDLLKAGLDQKPIELMAKETKRITAIRFLKSHGGPFTCSEDVEVFMKNDMTEKEKQRHLRAEVAYCRDTCLSLQNDHPLFKIMSNDGSHRSVKPSHEFASNLMTFFGKLSDQGNADSLSLFRLALQRKQQQRVS